MNALLLCLLAAEITLKLDVPTSAVVTVTISAGSQTQTTTNTPPAVLSARTVVPRAIPMPPALPMVGGRVLRVPKPLPDATNYSSYAQYQRRLAEAESSGRRRSQ